jgi:queuine tRNA-ribosyltransferase
VQGGIDPELRSESTRVIASMPFDGIAVGGLAGSETKEEMAAALDVVDEALGDDPRVRYLMGIGSPLEFLTAAEHGIDLFDSVLPTRVARNGQLWTSEGRLNMRNARFQDDPGPIDPTCGCETCRNHSRAYLAHLFRAEELLAYRLATLHNVTWTLALMARLRASLTDGSFHVLRATIESDFIRLERSQPPPDRRRV